MIQAQTRWLQSTLKRHQITLGGLRGEDGELQASLDYKVRARPQPHRTHHQGQRDGSVVETEEALPGDPTSVQMLDGSQSHVALGGSDISGLSKHLPS